MTIEEIRELINIVNESGVAELEVQRGDNRVRIRRTQRESRVAFTAVDSHALAPAVAPSAAPPTPVATPKPPEPLEDELLVKSPIVGTFYEASSPSNPPFVRVGETVQPGAVLCITK